MSKNGQPRRDAHPSETRRVFLEFRPDFDDLSKDEQMAVCRGMAEELQRQLGLTDSGSSLHEKQAGSER